MSQSIPVVRDTEHGHYFHRPIIPSQSAWLSKTSSKSFEIPADLNVSRCFDVVLQSNTATVSGLDIAIAETPGNTNAILSVCEVI